MFEASGMLLFLIVIFLVGIALCFYTFRIVDIVEDCPEATQNAKMFSRILTYVSLSMTLFSGTLIAFCNCSLKSSIIRTQNIDIILSIIFVMLGIFVIVITVMINNGCPKVKKDTQIPVYIAIGLIAASVLNIMRRVYYLSKSYGHPLLPRGYQKPPTGTTQQPSGIELQNLNPRPALPRRTGPPTPPPRGGGVFGRP